MSLIVAEGPGDIMTAMQGGSFCLVDDLGEWSDIYFGGVSREVLGFVKGIQI